MDRAISRHFQGWKMLAVTNAMVLSVGDLKSLTCHSCKVRPLLSLTINVNSTIHDCVQPCGGAHLLEPWEDRLTN